MYRHSKDKLAILQVEMTPLKQCPSCGIHMNASKMIRNKRTDMCNREMEICMQRHKVEISQRSEEMKLHWYDR